MNLIAELHDMVDALATVGELDVPSGDLTAAARQLSDDQAIEALSRATALINGVERLRVVVAGVTAERSTRERGYKGVAQVRGHRTPESLIQSVTGVTRAEASRQVRLGESMLEGGMPLPGAAAEAELLESDASLKLTSVVALPWHEPLRRFLLDGILTSAQHDAILRGLGEPPEPGDDDADAVTIDGIVRAFVEVSEVWRIAAEQLAAAAHRFTVEDLAKEARRARDLLHPEGAAERFTRRFETRSFRKWTDANGQQHAHFNLEDEGAALISAMIDAALRPRRGGPRFVTDEERAAAKKLVDDPRSNEQLEYDLLLATLKAGSLATAADVFGARQPGVRVVVAKDATTRRDAFGRMLGVGHLEDRGDILAGPVVDRALCTTGFQEVVVDTAGNPLYLGREHRLYSAKQKLTLAVRDGGCLIPGCPMPASYCESHHIDHYERDRGKTDIDRGVLLCAFHHMLCHNNGWEITRDGLGDFILHLPPGMGPPIVLRSKSPLAFPLLA